MSASTEPSVEGLMALAEKLAEADVAACGGCDGHARDQEGRAIAYNELRAYAERLCAPSEPGEALQAARYRWLRDHTGAGQSTIGSPVEFRLPVVPKIAGRNLLKGSVAQHLDEAIDAARALAQGDPK